MWTDAKTQLKTDTLKNMLTAKVNINMPCLEFHDLIKSNEKLPRSIHSSLKYKWTQTASTSQSADKTV